MSGTCFECGHDLCQCQPAVVQEASARLEQAVKEASQRWGRSCDYPIPCSERHGDAEWDDPDDPWTVADWCDACLGRMLLAELRASETQRRALTEGLREIVNIGKRFNDPADAANEAIDIASKLLGTS